MEAKIRLQFYSSRRSGFVCTLIYFIFRVVLTRPCVFDDKSEVQVLSVLNSDICGRHSKPTLCLCDHNLHLRPQFWNKFELHFFYWPFNLRGTLTKDNNVLKFRLITLAPIRHGLFLLLGLWPGPSNKFKTRLPAFGVGRVKNKTTTKKQTDLRPRPH